MNIDLVEGPFGVLKKKELQRVLYKLVLVTYP